MPGSVVEQTYCHFIRMGLPVMLLALLVLPKPSWLCSFCSDMHGQINSALLGEEAGYLGDSIFQWLAHVFFSIFIDFCLENHPLAENNVLSTMEKMFPNQE